MVTTFHSGFFSQEFWSFQEVLFFSCLLEPLQGKKIIPSCWDTVLCFAVLRSRFSSFRFVPVKVRTLNKPTETSLFFQPSALAAVNKELSLSALLPLRPLRFSKFPLMQQAPTAQFCLRFKVEHNFLSVFQVEMPWKTAFLYREGKPIQTHSIFFTHRYVGTKMRG